MNISLIDNTSAVAVGTASFIQPDCATRIIAGIRDYCVAHHVARLSDLVGSLALPSSILNRQ